tara:strand:- start:245 stop:793 length:549 start_codon:yes stop_codon:yes gene_type:complete
MNSQETTDYLNVVNPFCCKSATQIRLGMDKDPRNIKKTDENKNIIIKGEKNTYFYNSTDEALCYTFGDDKEKELVGIDKYDYEVPAEVLNKKCKYKEHKEGLPLSFLQIDNEVDGIEWYKKHYPKIPDDLLSIIARYHWGEPITKKSIKNEKKKIQRKVQAGKLKVLTRDDNEGQPFYVKFD